MDAVLAKAGNVLLDQGVIGLVTLGLAYLCWRLIWLWVNEAQKRAAADLEDAKAKDAVAKSLDKLSATVERLGQFRPRDGGSP